MKKNLFFVFTMLCALSFFTACSDDDDNKTDDGWKAISATYTAETLKLTMGGTEVADQSVKVDARQNTCANEWVSCMKSLTNL